MPARGEVGPDKSRHERDERCHERDKSRHEKGVAESVIREGGVNRYPLGLGRVGVWFNSYSYSGDPSPPGCINPTVR
jgi:hypothetical protein